MRKLTLPVILASLLHIVLTCDLHAPGTEKAQGDGGFEIQILGNPEKYVPQSTYTIKLTSKHQQKFKNFNLFLDNKQIQDGWSFRKSQQSTGVLQIFPNDKVPIFDLDCMNAVSDNESWKEKTEVQMMWLAPTSGSGCVQIGAHVVVANKVYSVSREICELMEGKEAKYMDCCACDEARYSFIFEGLWRNETHPKDFPKSLWLTHFSDVVGGTHGKNFSFWGEGQIATPGLKQLAEWGATRIIDSELKTKSRFFRTLIKAPGLWYPNVNANTSSNFRVDRRRNLLSLVSMLGPSPDWIVGVSGLNLCLPNCSWIERLNVDLYPYDAGTDNGVSYMSINIPAVPQEKIHKITPMYPEDERAPFYDPENNFMNPLARIYITREKLVKKPCTDKTVSELLDEVNEAEHSEEADRKECAVTNYSDWSPCSVPCGKGLRMRSRQYVDSEQAKKAGCNRQLVSKEMCVAENATCPGEEDEEEIQDQKCAVGEWEEWSECSVSCGQGLKTRVRRFPDKKKAKACPHIELVQREPCVEPPCAEVVVDPLCPVTDWSDWSPCNATCGYGFKVHTRFLLADRNMEDYCLKKISLSETKRCKSPRGDCKMEMTEVKSVCMLPEETGPCHEFYERFRFEPMKGMCIPFSYGGCRGNKNNFFTQQECLDFCKPMMEALSTPVVNTTIVKFVDCVMSPWGEWGDCVGKSNKCGSRGVKTQSRSILVQPQGGGRPCSGMLTRNRPCKVRC